MRYFSMLFVAIIAISCASNKQTLVQEEERETEEIPQTDIQISGTIVDQSGASLAFSKVMLIQDGEMVFGVNADIEGEYKFDNVPAGVYDLEVNFVGYEPRLIKKIKVKASNVINVEMLESNMPEIITLKPVIYLYPEKEMDISVSLSYKGELTHTYPKYPVNGWNVKAQPDGTLFDKNEMEYYALFWEGKPTNPIQPTDGFVVPGNETAAFLEEELAYLGLNRREANEFIMFWLPQMENNAFNLIHFSSHKYEELAELKVTPKPETIIRVMMIYRPLKSKIDMPKQDLSKLKKERKGYTLVEWGGSISPSPID